MKDLQRKLNDNVRIALGGGCHWCTEAVFQSLKGVENVAQGFVSSTGEHHSFSEAVIVDFNPLKISLRELIEIHLHTHKSTSAHSMRNKYRSAVYTYSNVQHKEAKYILEELQRNFDHRLITDVLPYENFKPSDERFKNYYFTNPQKPFCQNYISPKLELLRKKFSANTDAQKIKAPKHQQN